MSLWTPSGEHPVDRDAESTPPSTADPTAGEAGPSMEDLSPEQRAQVEEMARQMQEAQTRMLKLPAGTVIGQQALQFYELAAIYLSQDPPRLDDARSAIDAFAAVLDALGSRLGEAEQPIRQTLNQIQLAFVEVSKRSSSDT